MDTGSPDPDDPLQDLYDVDDESTIITLADWYRKCRLVLEPNVLLTSFLDDTAPDAQKVFFETGVVPIPDTGLINGVGRYQGGPEVPYAVIVCRLPPYSFITQIIVTNVKFRRPSNKANGTASASFRLLAVLSSLSASTNIT